MANIFDLGLDGVGTQIIAIGALGTAAFGLADASKVIWGGPSRAGFGYIVKALKPFETALRNAVGSGAGKDSWQQTLRAHWLNGRQASDQKAIATSLIQLGLTPETAPEIAPHVHLEPAAFKSLIVDLTQGKEMTPEQITMLGRFKASVEAVIDAAYERADQAYRNMMRLVSGTISVGLAVVASAFSSQPDYVTAVLIGLVAVPLAPMAKDVASALQAAGSALAAKK